MSFRTRKAKILSQLAVPDEEYDDLSPKGSIDINIRELIDEINGLEGAVTTSSCGGRISVFLEGRKTSATSEEGEDQDRGSKEDEGEGDRKEDVGEKSKETIAKIGGKGGGGRWLYVSHDPISLEPTQTWAEKFGMKRPTDASFDLTSDSNITDVRFVRFKFEPMILHVLTESLEVAQKILSAALQSGFRESGALNLTSPSTVTPMVGIRSMGLGLESIIGIEKEGEVYCIIPEWQLRNLVEISHQRFEGNDRRIGRFRGLVKEAMGEGSMGKGKGDGGEWEDPKVRAERKREEGLRRRELARLEKDKSGEGVDGSGGGGDDGYEIGNLNGF